MADSARTREAFEELLDLPEEDRAAALDRMELGADQRARVLRLLDEDRRLESREAIDARRAHAWPGDVFGSWRLVAPVGEGGMGSVWLATSVAAPDVTVAVKLPRGKGVSEEEARARLGRERAILARLSHPGIITLVDAGERDGGTPFLVLEAIQGDPLDVWLRRGVDLDARLHVLVRLAAAIDAMHASGVVHRDLKPANVLVDVHGESTIVDFGIARRIDSGTDDGDFRTVGAAPRTPAFASPEQVRGEEATPGTDVYALGRIAEIVLGEAGLDDGSRSRLSAVLAQATHGEVHRRQRSARALVQEIASAVRPRSAAALAGRGRMIVLASLALLPVLFVLGWMMGSGTPGTSGAGDRQKWEQAFRKSLENTPEAIGRDALDRALRAGSGGGIAAVRERLAIFEDFPFAQTSSELRAAAGSFLLHVGRLELAAEALGPVPPLDQDWNQVARLREVARLRCAFRRGLPIDRERLARLAELWEESPVEDEAVGEDLSWPREAIDAEPEEELGLLRIALGDRAALVAWSDEFEGELSEDLEPALSWAFEQLRSGLGPDVAWERDGDGLEERIDLLEEGFDAGQTRIVDLLVGLRVSAWLDDLDEDPESVAVETRLLHESLEEQEVGFVEGIALLRALEGIALIGSGNEALGERRILEALAQSAGSVGEEAPFHTRLEAFCRGEALERRAVGPSAGLADTIRDLRERFPAAPWW